LARARAAVVRDGGEREFFIDNLLVRIHCIIVMIRWTGLAPWGCEFPFPGSLTYAFLGMNDVLRGRLAFVISVLEKKLNPQA